MSAAENASLSSDSKDDDHIFDHDAIQALFETRNGVNEIEESLVKLFGPTVRDHFLKMMIRIISDLNLCDICYSKKLPTDTGCYCQSQPV